MTSVDEGLLMKRTIAAGIVICVIGGLLIALAGNPFDVFHRASADIEAYLRLQTPLGSSQTETIAWLRGHDIDARVHEVRVKPGSEYPLTGVGGASFIHESITHYWWPLRVDVEAFYVFDERGKLADIRVRKTTDAL
jgi:hypothetical protein